MNKFKLGGYSKYDCFTYPGGELQVRIKEEFIPNLGSDNIFLAKIRSPHDIMETLLLHDAITGASKRLLGRGLILPYLPYSRADRRFVNGDCLGKEVFISHIGNVMTLDVHSHKADDGMVLNIPPTEFITKAVDDVVRRYGRNKGLVFLFPDEGAAKRYTLSYNPTVLETLSLYCFKKRDPETGKLSGFQVPSREEFAKLPGAPVLIVDDLCDGGGTFLGIAEALAKEIGIDRFDLNLYVTHGIFSKGFEALGEKLNTIYTTDSFSDSLRSNPHRGKVGLVVYSCDSYLEGLAEVMLSNGI